MLYDIQKKIILFCLAMFVGSKAQVRVLDTSYFKLQHPILKEILNDAPKYRVQIFLSYRKKGEWNHEFFGDSGRYFYPASLVKFPVALAVARMLEEKKISFDVWDSLYILRNEAPGLIKTKSQNQSYSVKDHIIRSLVVSDNESFNLLFESCGFERIRSILQEAECSKSRVVHHFGKYYRDGDTLRFPSVKWMLKSQVVDVFHRRHSVLEYKDVEDGVVGDSVNRFCKAKDFRRSNFMPLTELHRLLIYFVTKGRDWFRDSMAYLFFRRCLTAFPNEMSFSGYDSSAHYPALKKYLYYGSAKNAETDTNVTICNFVGQSYGFLTDVAHLTYNKKQISFFISATVYVNKGNCFGSGKYEYKEKGFPYLEFLGKAALRYVSEKSGQ